MNKRLCGLLTVLFVSLSSICVAQQSTPPVTILEEKGRSITVTWPDGREAVVMAAYGPLKNLEFPVLVTENLCNENFNITLIFSKPVKGVILKLVWSKNPDVTRLGRSVIDVKSETEYLTYRVFDSSISPLAPLLARGLPPLEITATDYSWLPGGTQASPPKHTDVALWNAEINVRNLETGVTENHAYQGAQDVSLDITNKNSLILSSARFVLGQQGFGGNQFLGETISLFVKDPQNNNQTCQITLKPDLTKSRAENNMYKVALFETKTEPYVLGNDEFYQYENNFGLLLRRLNIKHFENKNGKQIIFYTETPVK